MYNYILKWKIASTVYMDPEEKEKGLKVGEKKK